MCKIQPFSKLMVVERTPDEPLFCFIRFLNLQNNKLRSSKAVLVLSYCVSNILYCACILFYIFSKQKKCRERDTYLYSNFNI